MSETREELYPSDTGRWLVTTQGTRHLWDLDRLRYVRVPGPASHAGSSPLDGVPCRITRVGVWPQVGKSFFVWLVEPVASAIELWWRSSTVARIERIEPGTDVAALLGTAAGDADGPVAPESDGQVEKNDAQAPSKEED